MSKQTIIRGGLTAVIAASALGLSASAANATGDAIEPVGTPLAEATMPEAGVTTTFNGQTVPAGGVALSDRQIAYDGGAAVLTLSSPEPPTTFALGDCPGGFVCLWSGGSYNDRKLQFGQSGSCNNLGDYGFNDQASSYYSNMFSSFARLRRNSNCTGDFIHVDPGGRAASLSTYWNNEISSVGIS